MIERLTARQTDRQENEVYTDRHRHTGRCIDELQTAGLRTDRMDHQGQTYKEIGRQTDRCADRQAYR